MPVLVDRRAQRRASLKLWRRILASIAGLIILALAAALLNNNVSIPRPSRTEFADNLDQTLDRGTEWALQQYQQTGTGAPTPEGQLLLSNAATAHMIVDCASISTDARMKALASRFIEAWKDKPTIIGKIVDPSIPMKVPNQEELQSIEEYQRWILYGAAPLDVSLSPHDRGNMFSSDKYRRGKATHQLFALYFYRRSKGSTPELDRLMDTIEHQIAWESAFDFRVTDLYLQRLAFLLAAGRPDLIRPRWAERALAAQQPDGGWMQNWHGWSRTPWRYSFHDEMPTAHATAQGLWTACMLKYRYPEWIEQNYK